MMMLIELLVLLTIFAVIWWAVSQLPLPPPFRWVAVVIIAVVAVLMLMQLLPGGLQPLRFR